MRHLLNILCLFAIAGCDTCPPSMDVALGNGESVSAPADSGPARMANATWAFYADTGVPVLDILGTVINPTDNLLFRAEFGSNGEIVRIFDNQVLSPATLGDEIILDNTRHATLDSSLTITGESYGAENGADVGLATCLIISFGPFTTANVRVEFSGTANDLLGRVDGQYVFTSDVNPFFASFMSPPPVSQTKEISGYAVREG